ncbi:MAG: prolipoprotein diacylglyceryl transferase [Clostridia bacterium]|nr:prolipoprotein diacylglyceryl transferase [Clostridia bacterium]
MEKIHKISFPGLGIGEFNIDSLALDLNGLTVAWYGIIIVTGIFLAVLYIYLRSKRKKLLMDDLIDIAFCTVIPGIVGARLYYVFFDWLKNPAEYDSLEDVVAVWNGGLAIYGGIIFGALGCLMALRWKKIRIPAFFDILAPAVQMAQAIGRWGNFTNAEAFGSETTLPWRMKLECVDHNCSLITNGMAVHPTFLYESLWNLIGFVFLTLYSKKKKFDGEIFLLYLGWYGLGRMFIEGLRTDSLYIGGLRVSQWLAAACLAAALILLVRGYFVKKLRGVADCLYLPESKRYAEVMQVAADGAVIPNVAAFEQDGDTTDQSDGGTEAPSDESDADPSETSETDPSDKENE